MKHMFCAIAAPRSFVKALPNAPKPSYSTELVSGLELSLYHHFASKPVSDSFLDMDDNGFSFCEGVLLSHKPDYLKGILKSGLHSDLAGIHGQFACLRFDRQTGELRAYTNVNNNLRVYYYFQGDTLIVASSIKLIIGVLKANGITCHPDELGIRMLLTYGFMLKHHSSIEEVRQLGTAGLLSYKNGSVSVTPYFRYNLDSRYHSYKSCADDLTDLFTEAVRSGMERDGRQRHFAFLSGGLDSRITVFTLNKLNARQVDILNFSQPGFIDQTVARQISDLLGYNYTFFSLAGGEYLKPIDKVLEFQEGQTVLHGAAHLFAAIGSVDLSKNGILHTGLLGEFIKGDFLDASHHVPVNFMTGAYSTRLLPSLVPELRKYAPDYVNNEHFLLENRGFNGITNGDLACLYYSHSASANLHPAFLQYTLNIDPSLRFRAKMQLYWINKNYPEAARFKSERFFCPVNTPYYLAYANYLLRSRLNRLSNVLTGQEDHLHMNPFQYWWANNPSLRQHFEPRFKISEAMTAILSKELVRDLSALYAERSFSEKLHAYSALRGLEYVLN